MKNVKKTLLSLLALCFWAFFLFGQNPVDTAILKLRKKEIADLKKSLTTVQPGSQPYFQILHNIHVKQNQLNYLLSKK